MSLEEQVQLEFPFMDKIRHKLYAEYQRKEMKDLWNLSYRYDGDNGKEMRFGDFIADVWVRGGMAEAYYKMNHRKFFYDDPSEPQYEGRPL